MKTTLRKIKEKRLNDESWTKLLKSLNKTKADEEPLSILHIIESNGIEDAIWCLRAVEGHDRTIRLFSVWCARQVQHLMEDPRSLKALDVAEAFAKGLATEGELEAASAAARAAARAAASYAAREAASYAASYAAREAASYAASATASATASSAAWTAASYTAWTAAWTTESSAASYTAWTAASDAASDAARAAASDAARENQKLKLIELLRGTIRQLPDHLKGKL